MPGPLSYDHPNFVVRREYFLPQTSAASATDFARFASRQKVRLYAFHVVCTSAPSLATPEFIAYNIARTLAANNATMATLTFTGTVSAGSMPGTLPSRGSGTCFTFQTLHTMGETAVLRMNDSPGIYNIIWEYQVLSDSTMT